MSGYVKDRTVAFILDESVTFDDLEFPEWWMDQTDGLDGEELDAEVVEFVSRQALRALNKKVGVRERIILDSQKPERVYRIWVDAEKKQHLHCVKR